MPRAPPDAMYRLRLLLELIACHYCAQCSSPPLWFRGIDVHEHCPGRDVVEKRGGSGARATDSGGLAGHGTSSHATGVFDGKAISSDEGGQPPRRSGAVLTDTLSDDGATRKESCRPLERESAESPH